MKDRIITLAFLKETMMAQLNIRQWQRLINPVVAWVILCSLVLSLTPGFTSTAQGSNGQRIYALTTSNRLLRFNSTDPCKINFQKKVTGLQKGENLLGIDFRPANGKLYGLGSVSRLYTINPETAVATLVGTGSFTTPLSGKAFGFDFNPTVDRIRIVSDTGQNLRLNPDTGAIAGIDAMLTFTPTDTYAGSQPSIVAAAYTNNDNDPNTGTTLYDIDSKLDILAIQNPPNDGKLNTVGQLGFNTTRLVGFDISTSSIAYAVLMGVQQDEEREADDWENGKRKEEEQKGEQRGGGRKCGTSLLTTVDLATGKVARVGFIGSLAPVRGLAIPTQ